MVFQLIKQYSFGTLHPPGILSFKHDYVREVIYCSMHRPHQHCASFAELLLKGFISKAKDMGNRKQIYILMDQERSYDCDGLNNQYTKMVE